MKKYIPFSNDVVIKIPTLEALSNRISRMKFYFRSYFVLSLIFIQFFSFSINAQPFSLHLDKPFYIAGESIQYCIYPDRSIVADSMLIYVELYSNSGQIKLQHIHRLQSKSVDGVIPLPVSWTEGNYLFICYAVWDDIQTDSSIIKSYREILPIYNDLEIKPSEDLSFSPIDSIQMIPTNLIATFSNRSKAILSLNINHTEHPTQYGDYSVSVFHSIMDVEDHKVIREPEVVIDASRYKIRKQLVVSGTVSDPFTHKPIDDKNLSLYIPAIKSFKRITAVKGIIKAIIPDIQENTTIQVLSMNPNSRYPLVLDAKASVFPFAMISALPKLDRSPIIQSILKQYAKARLINDIFEKKSISEMERMDTTIEFSPDKRFKLSDFQELTTLEEFIKEVLLDAHITTIINNKKSLRLRNKDLNQLYRWPAWYLLDNVFQADENSMLNYDIAKIKSIDLYHKNQTVVSQFDPIMRYNGIFSINTYLHEESSQYIYSIQGLTRQHSLSNQVDMPDTTPDLREMIFWKTGVKQDTLGNINLQFQAGDIKGKYKIDLKGINMDGIVVHEQYAITIN